MAVTRDQQALASELFDLARSTASSAGRTFKPIADNALRQLTQDAASEVLRPGRFGAISSAKAIVDIDVRKNEARAAVRSLVDAMAAHAVTIPGYETDFLGDRTLAYALAASGLCPCWPIC
jgi:hypothetical protein